MKVLYGAAGAAIFIVLLLAPVALFPETVLDVVDDVKNRFVERARLRAEWGRRVEAANNGDPDQKFVIASWHLSEQEWWRQELFEDLLGPRDPEQGLAMMRELVSAGHPEALYQESGGIDADESIWSEALEAGSRSAVRELHNAFVVEPCDDRLFAHVAVLRSRLGDPAYPWQHPDVDESQKEWRRDWKATLVNDIIVLDSLRATSCAAE